jgi:hypothetical protein
MLAVQHSIEMFVVDLFKSRCQLEAKNLILHTSIRQETAALQELNPGYDRSPDMGRRTMCANFVASILILCVT